MSFFFRLWYKYLYHPSTGKHSQKMSTSLTFLGVTDEDDDDLSKRPSDKNSQYKLKCCFSPGNDKSIFATVITWTPLLFSARAELAVAFSCRGTVSALFSGSPGSAAIPCRGKTTKTVTTKVDRREMKLGAIFLWVCPRVGSYVQ